MTCLFGTFIRRQAGAHSVEEHRESSTSRYCGNLGNHMGLHELKEEKPQESLPQISYSWKWEVLCFMFSKGPA